MIRRLNYTGRKRIPADHIRIAIHRNGNVEEFEAVLRFDGLDLPASARVWIEPYHKSDWMRFDFGTVGAPQTPRDRRLTAFYQGARVLFRVKTVAADKDAGTILAEADRVVPVSPDSERDRDPLLPVRLVDGMDDQIWRVVWSNGAVLELNRQEPEIKRLLTSDSRFKWLVLPAVLRAVLTRVLHDESDDEAGGEAAGEGRRWVEFALSIHPVPPPSREDRDSDTIEAWADDVAAAFCRRHEVLRNWRWALRPDDDLFRPL